MNAPERSRTSLNATAPSPIASARGPSGAISSASASGAIARGASRRRLERLGLARSASRPRTPRRGGRRAPPDDVEPGRAPRRRPSAGSPTRPPRPATAASRPRPAGTFRARASARAVAIPIRSPVNVPGPTPTAIRSTSSQPIPARSSTLDDQRQQPRGVAGPRARRAGRRARCRRRRRRLAQGDGGRASGGVEGQDPHAAARGTSAQRTSIRTTVDRRPRARSRRAPRCARAPRASRPRLPGHSTNAIVIRADVVGEQVRDPRPPRSATR